MLGFDYYVLFEFCNESLIQIVDLVIRSTFDKMSEKNPASGFGVLLLTLQLNFIATRRFGDQDPHLTKVRRTCCDPIIMFCC
jgi:hypothetical protein